MQINNQTRQNKRLSLKDLFPETSPETQIEYRGYHAKRKFKGTILSLSRSGLFIRASHIPLKGDVIFLSFYFDNRYIHCLGKVIYLNRVGDGFRPQGFGIKFLRMMQNDYEGLQKSIDLYYQSFFEFH